MFTMSTPTQMTLKDLLETHPGYNPMVSTPSGNKRPILDKYQDIYEGGERFENNKGLYLRSRARDQDKSFREARLSSAHFTGQAGSLIDWLAASVFREEPEIVSAPDDYYLTLNNDCDGSGLDFSALCQNLALEAMLYRRSYLAVDFPGGAASSLADAKVSRDGSRPALDAYLTLYGAREVDDWGEDSRGNLEWVRIHTTRNVRSGYSQAGESIEHTWTYIDNEAQTRFNWVQEGNKDVSKEDKETAIKSGNVQKVDGLPVFRVDIPTGFWVMHGLASTQLAIFNADAGLAFLYDTNCYQMPVIKTARDMKSLVVGELSAIKLDPGEDASFLSPSGVPFEQLRQWIDKLEARLYLRVQAMGLQAASKDEHGRQSGVAKQRDMDAAHALLACYRGRIKDACQSALKYIAEKRSEPNEFEIEGFGTRAKEDLKRPAIVPEDTQDDPGEPEAVTDAE